MANSSHNSTSSSSSSGWDGSGSHSGSSSAEEGEERETRGVVRDDDGLLPSSSSLSSSRRVNRGGISDSSSSSGEGDGVQPMLTGCTEEVQLLFEAFDSFGSSPSFFRPSSFPFWSISRKKRQEMITLSVIAKQSPYGPVALAYDLSTSLTNVDIKLEWVHALDGGASCQLDVDGLVFSSLFYSTLSG